MKVSMDKSYKSKAGRPYRIICFDSGSTLYPVVAVTSEGDVATFTEDGRYYAFSGHDDRDLVEVNPYEEWKIDDKIIVGDVTNCFHTRHFAGISNEGLPLAWVDGKTSHTTDQTTSWRVAKLAE